MSAVRLFQCFSRYSRQWSSRISWQQASLRTISVGAVSLNSDTVTHTGQQWEDDDYRNVRFVGKQKQVNEKFAIDLVAEEPVVVVEGNHVWCDGGRGALGHPRVYINLDKPEINVCGYCGKRFVAKATSQTTKT